jgi:hypothetical protein
MTMWVEAFMPPSAWGSSIPASALGAWALPRCKSHEYGNDAIALLNMGCSKGDVVHAMNTAKVRIRMID